jgi:hypothetical protein
VGAKPLSRLLLPELLTRRFCSSTPTPRRKPPSLISTIVRLHRSLVLDLEEARAPGVVAAVLPVPGQVLEDASAEWTTFGAQSVGADHAAVEKAVI